MDPRIITYVAVTPKDLLINWRDYEIQISYWSQSRSQNRSQNWPPLLLVVGQKGMISVDTARL